MTVEKRNKLDLLTFQKTLNAQFLDIFEKKKDGDMNDIIETEQLGLIDNAFGYDFFFPLKDLKSISSENKFENLPLTQSWVAGFNQIRGDVFTIIDFYRVVEYLIKGFFNPELRKLTLDSNILYLKDQNIAKTGLIINSLKMKHTEQCLQLFKFSNNDNLYHWHLDNHLQQKFSLNDGTIDSIINKNILGENEFILLSKLNEISLEKKFFTQTEIELLIDTTHDVTKLLWIMIGDVMIDTASMKPLFVVDLNRLTKFLINVSPF